MATREKGAIVAQEQGAVTTAGFNYGEEAGAGFEGTSSADLSIPFLQILQSNSPQVETDNPVGSKAGMLYNTVTRELLEGVTFLPVFKQDTYVEWVPRDNGGGFVGLHEPESAVVKGALAAVNGDKFAKLATEAANDLIETHYMYGLLLDETGTSTNGFAVIGFNSTKIKPYRDWLTAMYMVKGRPPLFAFRAQINTVRQKNDKGSYFNFNVSPLKETWVNSLINPVTELGLLEEAKAFREMITSGTAKAAYETQNPDTAPNKADIDDDKPPF